jgi:hypothetical protein
LIRADPKYKRDRLFDIAVGQPYAPNCYAALYDSKGLIDKANVKAGEKLYIQYELRDRFNNYVDSKSVGAS